MSIGSCTTGMGASMSSSMSMSSFMTTAGSRPGASDGSIADEGGVDQRAHPDHAGEGLTEPPHLLHGDDDGDADHGGQVHHAEGDEHQHQGPAAPEAEQAVLDAGSQVTQAGL